MQKLSMYFDLFPELSENCEPEWESIMGAGMQMSFANCLYIIQRLKSTDIKAG